VSDLFRTRPIIRLAHCKCKSLMKRSSSRVCRLSVSVSRLSKTKRDKRENLSILSVNCRVAEQEYDVRSEILHRK